MTIPNELRELLEQICVELEHDNDRYMLARELRKALAKPAAPADGEAVEALRSGFISWLGIDHCGAAHDLAWAAWKACAAQRDAKMAEVVEALREIEWSNNSQWQADRASAALAASTGQEVGK